METSKELDAILEAWGSLMEEGETDALSVREIQERTGMSPKRIRQNIRMAMAAGRMEMVRKNDPLSLIGNIQVPAYRVIRLDKPAKGKK